MLHRNSLLLSSLPSVLSEVYFHEPFKTMDNWKASTWKPASEMQDFVLQPVSSTASEDLALSTTQDARFYASSAHFDEFSNEKKSLLVQYEVKYDKDVECGGGYLKMGPKLEDSTKFGDPSEYAIMFGPDKCGHTKRTHLIFNYKGKNVLKKVDLPYKQDEPGVTTLYRMLLHPDNKVVVEINGEEVFSGSLENDWDLLPAKEIDDPDDKKPSDWVDDAMIDDPSDSKPSDWVEVKEIVDSSAKQPEDWDTEEDGTWEAPMIPNPDYKGDWKPKRISNPEYKGVWAPKKIANPDYVEDTELYLMNKKKIAYVGFDLWQVKSASKFDNIFIAGGEKGGDWMTTADDIKNKCLDKREAEKKFKESTTTTTTTTEAEAPEKDDDDDL